MGPANPAVLAGEAEQGLQHCHREQFGIAQLRGDPTPRTGRDPFGVVPQHVVGEHVQCGGEGVQISVHEGLPARVGYPTPILDILALKSHPPHQSHHQESII
jgi:hypothetical protein